MNEQNKIKVLTNIGGTNNEPEHESTRDAQSLHQASLNYVENRHRVNLQHNLSMRSPLQKMKNKSISHLIAPYNVNDHHQVSSSNEPRRPLQRHQNIVGNVLSEGPVADEGHREVADCIDEIGEHGPFPHRPSRRLLRRGWDGGLDFQGHRVPSVCKGDLPQCVEHSEHSIHPTRFLVPVAHARGAPLAQAAHPRYG